MFLKNGYKRSRRAVEKKSGSPDAFSGGRIPKIYFSDEKKHLL
jgi:hypothetical protein